MNPNEFKHYLNEWHEFIIYAWGTKPQETFFSCYYKYVF